jgi:hypothetical protein
LFSSATDGGVEGSQTDSIVDADGPNKREKREPVPLAAIP